MPVELHGQHVQLLPLSHRDADDIFALSRLPEVMRYTSMPPQTRESSDAFLTRWLAGMHEGRIASWTIRDKKNAFLGQASIFDINATHHSGEIGYLLMPDAWGKGYASDVVATLVRYGFHYRHLARLNADVDPANRGSIRVLEKHGFVREGARRASGYKEGAFYDSILYGLLNEQRIRELTESS